MIVFAHTKFGLVRIQGSEVKRGAESAPRSERVFQIPVQIGLKFADHPILPLWMNQAKTIQKNPLKFVYHPTLPLWMNQAITIWKNALKLQMTLFCTCG